MKSDNALLAAWEETLARKRDAPAIFDTRGKVLRTFAEVESRARTLESKTSGPVFPIDIGNQPDWPSHLLAALRRRVVALPLEGTITAQQREAEVNRRKIWGDEAADYGTAADNHSGRGVNRGV